MSPVLARTAFSVLIVCLASAAHSQGRSWNADQSDLKPGESTNAVKAKIPNPRPIKTPGPEVPEGIRGLSGRWIGWAGRTQSASVAIDVEELTAKGGTVAYYFAAPDFTTPYEYRFAAVLVNGNELEGSLGGWTSVKLRLRPDGNADFMVWWNSSSRAGVLTKR